MIIEFKDLYIDDAVIFRVAFQAVANGVSVSCQITYEALQDIDPPNGSKSPSDLYLQNKEVIHDVAKRLIISGRVHNAQLLITTDDMKTQ
ncbi:MAG: DUF1488 family protein [Desulfuromonadaceae bacterium]